MNPSKYLFAGLATAALTAATHAQDWPQWRGASSEAKAAGFTAPRTWPKELTQKWKITIGEGVASPALAGGKLYVMSRQEGMEYTRCLDAATGKELWQDKYESQGASGPAQSFSGPRATPAVADGKVVTHGVRGVVSCFDAASGKLLWRNNDFAGAIPRFAVSSSPLIADGLCVVQRGSEGSGVIAAYNLDDGKEKWRTAGGPGYASPVLATIGGVKLVVAMTDSKVVALTLADGKLVWETPFTVQGRGYNAATPMVAGDTVIFTGSNRGVTAVKLEKSGDTFTAKELWKNPDNSVQFNTPVVKGNQLYGLTGNNQFFCVNLQDGKSVWTAPFAQPAAGGEPPPGGGGGGRGGRGGGMGGGGGYGSIVDAGSVMLALTPAAQLVVFAPSEKSFAEIARIKVAEGQTYAYPIPSGNRIYVKDRESLMMLALE